MTREDELRESLLGDESGRDEEFGLSRGVRSVNLSPLLTNMKRAWTTDARMLCG
jgi:hypothetical protein